MEHQDWDTIKLNQKTFREGKVAGNEAMRKAMQGDLTLETMKKYGAGGNRAAGPSNAAKLDADTETGSDRAKCHSAILSIPNACNGAHTISCNYFLRQVRTCVPPND